ncbi:MAG: hypothetical protein KJ621_03925 [Proteobacteria bacterium]|nr:hypothetical protein [Pseudomonadota bacterium]MBU1741356.1 hypothetical protein [Pseudomonadota bacterium]
MKCESCQAEIEAGDEREHAGRTLCEDCYMDALSPARSCDPWAVFSAKSAAELEGGAELTEVHQKMLHKLQQDKYVLPPDLAAHVGLSLEQLQKELAALRHLELIRGARKGGQVYVTRFDTPHDGEDN